MKLFIEGKKCEDCRRFNSSLSKKCTARKKYTNPQSTACFLLNMSDVDLKQMRERLKGRTTNNR